MLLTDLLLLLSPVLVHFLVKLVRLDLGDFHDWLNWCNCEVVA